MRISKSDTKSWFFVVVGIIFCLAAICGGLYLGLWICLVGGVVDVVNGFQATPIEALKVGIGVLKFFSSSIVGWITFVLGISIGKACFEAA